MALNEKMSCHVDAPYPEIGQLCCQPNCVAAIARLYAGKDSETTAIMQYMYHHGVIADICPETARILACISRTEMQHMHLLGKALLAMGQKPVYAAPAQGCCLPWNADMVFYGNDLPAMLKADIAIEKAAIAAYCAATELCGDGQLKALIERIILDEKLHLALLEGLACKHCIKI